MMKRLLRLSLTVLLLLALVPAAGADVIWEPQNSFYDTHRDQCEYVGRGYYANGREGFITLWEAPEGDRFTAQYENGQELTLYYRYRDWGCLSRWEDGREVSGWVPLSDLVLVYDHISFAEEYDIRPYAGEFAGYAGGAQSVHFYEYPGAPEVKYTWALDDPSWDVLDRLTGAGGESSYISSVFVDEEGLTWGYVSYLFGRLNGWFCLDRPDGTDFPLRDITQPELIAAQTPVPPAAAYLPWLLVAGVVLVTGGLLFWFYGRRRSRTDA